MQTLSTRIGATAVIPLANAAVTAHQEAYVRKVIDHSYFWTGLKAGGLDAQRARVWENSTRGNQCLFMDP